MRKRNGFNAQTYISPTKFAALIQALERSGVNYGRSTSSLLRASIDLLLQLIPHEELTTDEEALKFISIRGFSVKQLEDQRRAKGIVRQLREEVDLEGTFERKFGGLANADDQD